MSKFTKGPWKCEEDFGGFDVTSHEGVDVANVLGFDPDNTGFNILDECQANADIIAAAPDMYKFLDDLANGRGTDYPIEKLLAKARGEK